MKAIILIFLVLPLLGFSQLDIRKFGASESKQDNSNEIQQAIDQAIKSGETVYIPLGKWRIRKPLIVANYRNEEYDQVFIKIVGESTMWDKGNRSEIIASFKDAPILSIQKGKGCMITGINFQGAYNNPKMSVQELYASKLEDYGDKTCRDSKYSPYCAIAIDPFSYRIPPDGGYPSLTKYYRGNQSKGGSTGISISNCTFNNVTIGAIMSPNGYTQNAELITFENIRIGNCKIGITGCQPQEKLNRLINIGAWGRTHTVFAWNIYGEGGAGHYVIDGVNVAGDVVQLVHRFSGGYFPLYMYNVFAESIGSIGYWYAGSGDALTNSIINIRYPEQINMLPDNVVYGRYLSIVNCNIRYYGRLNYPILLRWVNNASGSYYTPPIKSNSGFEKSENYQIIEPFKVNQFKISEDRKLRIKGNYPQVHKDDFIFFLKKEDQAILGQGIIQEKSGEEIVIGFISPGIKAENHYRIGVVQLTVKGDKNRNRNVVDEN